MEFGILMGDETLTVSPREHLDILLREVEAAQRNGFTYLAIGQHFLYEGFRWPQPIPLLARLSAELDEHVRIGTTIIIAPLYHPVVLAEELATLDNLTDGRLFVGVGTGYLPVEYERMGVPFAERYGRLEEILQLMTHLWSQDRVTFHGRYFDLEDVPVHVRPTQQPRPPLWVGAMKEKGVRRAARWADVWTITPQQTVEEVGALMGVYAQERLALGLPLNHLPLRRELMIGADRQDALTRFQQVAQGKYVAYADRGMDLLTASEVRAKFAQTVGNHVILGDPQDCHRQITEIAGTLPVGPIIVRPHWPGMTAAQTIAYLDEVGEHVVRPLADLTSCSFEDALASGAIAAG